MRITLGFGLLLASYLLPTALAEPPPLTLARTIALPGVEGRIDHLAFDPSTARLFIAALSNNSLEVVDLKKGERTNSIGDLKEIQGVAHIAATRQVIVACGGDGTVRALDASTLEEKRRLKVGDDADNVRISPDGTSVVVGYGDGALAVLDAATLKLDKTITLPGHPESFQLEPGTKRVFVNVPGGFVGGGGAISVLDRAGQAPAASWKLEEAGRNFPMALDAPHKRLYVGCRRPARLLAMDTDSGRVIASLECIGDADDIFVDPGGSRIFVIGGDGAVDAFDTPDQITVKRTASISTAPGARTGLLVPERHALYVAVPKRGNTEAQIREYALTE